MCLFFFTTSLTIGGPPRTRGSIIGNINDIEFGIAFLNATIKDSPDLDTRRIQAKITNIPRTLGMFVIFSLFVLCLDI